MLAVGFESCHSISRRNFVILAREKQFVMCFYLEIKEPPRDLLAFLLQPSPIIVHIAPAFRLISSEAPVLGNSPTVIFAERFCFCFNANFELQFERSLEVLI